METADISQIAFYRSYYDVACKFKTPEERLAFYDAITAYAFEREEKEGLPYAVDIVFTQVKKNIDADIARKNGGRGGLNEETVNSIKADIIEGILTQKQIAEKYGISQGTVSKVKKSAGTEVKLVEKQEQVSMIQDKSTEKHEEKAQKIQGSDAVKKASKPHLLEREPANDIEKVEKVYLENYGQLYNKGLMKVEKPVINWPQSKKLTKDALDKYGLETVINAVKKSVDDGFCVQKGYVLTTILSSGVLAGLINGNDWHKGHAIDSVDHPADMGEVLF